MISFFTQAEGSILVRLLIAHCLTDFFFQPNSWIKSKKEKVWFSGYLYLHVMLTGAVAFLLIGGGRWWFAIATITLTHFIIDGFKLTADKKLSFKNKDLYLFSMDQLLHILVIMLVWLTTIKGFDRQWQLLHYLVTNYSIALHLLGYFLVMGPVGYLIHFATRKWTVDLAGNDSLQNAGKWIGILERVLILTMVFINQFGAIGFIVAAKSILRLTDKPDKPSSDPTMGKPFSSRKHTEYVLIGTFLSVGLAVIIGLMILALLNAAK